jgi:hypothetical protein
MPLAYRSGSITVTVDAEYVLDEVDDEQLLEKVARRKLYKKGSNGFDTLDEVEKAWRELLCGRPAEALSILDRIVNPKWASEQRCKTQYEQSRKFEL